MATHLGPTAIVAEPRPMAGTTRVPRATESLRTAVDAGLVCLRNLALVTSVIEAATVEDRLRAALKAGHPGARGCVAARIACAHLAAGDLTEAYFALLHARGHILGPTR